MPTKRCIVNYAKLGRENYPLGQARLEACLREGLGCNDGQLMLRGLPPHSPSHEEVPYAFKYYAINSAFEMGFEQVIWLDASVVILKSMEPLWKVVEERGVLVFDNLGCKQNQYTSGDTLNKLGCSLTEASTMYQVCGGVVGYNRKSPLGINVFSRMLGYAQDGVSFQGGSNESPDPTYIAHRHDQSCLTHLVYQYNVQRLPFVWLAYTSGVTPETILELRAMI